MLELRLTSDPKRVASMRDVVVRECARADLSPVHAAVVAYVTEQLIGDTVGRRGGRAAEVFVLLTVQSDATMLMVRDPRPELVELGDRRQRLLERYTSRWSTMSGRDGRTIWAEIEPGAELGPEAVEPVAVVEASPASTRAWSRPGRLRLGAMPTFAAPD